MLEGGSGAVGAIRAFAEAEAFGAGAFGGDSWGGLYGLFAGCLVLA